ncbi:hypothetical protein EBU99_07360 [bacterium]|nr:hypothetical protein [bacterium]
MSQLESGKDELIRFVKSGVIRLLFFVFLACFLVTVILGCASIGGTSQAVSVDSDPRGLFVSVNASPDKNDPRTPFSATLPRSSKLKLNFHFDEFEKIKTVDCHFRYGTVLGGNLPFALFTLSNPLSAALWYGSAIGLDVITGAGFECPFQVSHDLDVPEALSNEIAEKCPLVLLMPPETDGDLSLSSALLEEAKAFAKRANQQSCIEFVSPTVASAALKRSRLANVSVKEILKNDFARKRSQLLRDSEANLAVEMEVSSSTAKTVLVKFSLFDLYDGREKASFKKSFSRSGFEKLKGTWVSRVLGQSLSLIPNSIAFLNSYPTLQLTPDDRTTSERIGGRSSLMGLLSLTSVQHPDQFSDWDTSFQFGPELFFDAIRHRVVLNSDNAQDPGDSKSALKTSIEREFRGYAMTLPVDGIVSFHTPAGAFRIFVGYGPALYLSTSNTSENHAIKMYGIGHFGSDWVAYMSSHLFFQLGLHAFNRGKDNFIEKQGQIALGGWLTTTFGVGYYIPGTQGYVESLLAGR